MNPLRTIDTENGMWLCGCEQEADETGYCEDCLPLSIIKADIAESKPLKKKVDEDDIPLAVLARTFKEKLSALERNDGARMELFNLLSTVKK
jgi:hypothetical protein